MKIAYLMSRFPHLPETFILREMDMVKKQGVDVQLFPLLLQKESIVHPNAQNWLDGNDLYKPSGWGLIKQNFIYLFNHPIRYLTIFLKVILGNIGSLKFLVRGIYIFPLAVAMGAHMKEEGINHIHAHYATHPALAAWIIYNIMDIPYSVTVHAHDIFVDQTMLRTKLQPAKFIRTISVFNKDFLIQKLGNEFAQKIVVIHIGIEPRLYTSRVAKDDKVFRILNIGSLQPYKGQSILIQACGLLKAMNHRFECLIIGKGELQQNLQAEIDRFGLRAQVTLAGGKTEEEVRQLLPTFDCYVQPSIITSSGKMEGIPVAIMEAMACEVPVIATRISGVPELVEDQKTGFLIRPNDQDDLVKAIQTVIGQTQKSREMALLGKKKVAREFNLEKNVAELIALFNV